METIFDTIIKWFSSLVGAIIFLIAFIYRSKIRDIEKKFEEIINDFKTGLKEERKFKIGVLKRHEDNILEISKIVNDIAQRLTRVEQDLKWIKKNGK